MSAHGRVPGIGEVGRNVSANVQRLREAQGMTRTRLAEMFEEGGRSGGVLAISRIESLRRRVDADDLVVLARILNVEPADLLMDAPKCRSCGGTPPPGFTCNTCGMSE